ncbi:hypothetical protein [Bacillus suaedae]|uniref:Uncharacterized protein n=1 Tax=Halalkalibacter suaedae TaxID=2822140 RepID=A0A941APF3_9BACI|nr:hypothetical protein [Bacillus suaedae]MBP3951746.1 hypothetical protein [Bacillus suaedae]
MKNVYMLLLFAALAFVIGACGNHDSSISVGELTEREKAILSVTSDKSFVFDFNIESEYKELTVWMEKYKSGKLVDDQLGDITSMVEENGSIIFALSKNADEGQKTYNIGISSEGRIASVSGLEEDLNDLEKMASLWGDFQGKRILDEGEVVLAHISYSDAENGMRTLSTDFDEDVEGHMNELEQYDVTYLLKAKFIK